jgi:hypothetical protein
MVILMWCTPIPMVDTNSNGRKSTTGYVYLVGGGVITWMSKKQSVVTMSSTDVEYVALSEAGHEVCVDK